MSVQYVKKSELGGNRKRITLKNLRPILSKLPSDAELETGDTHDLMIIKDNEYIGFVLLLDGDGKYVPFKELVDELGIKVAQHNV